MSVSMPTLVPSVPMSHPHLNGHVLCMRTTNRKYSSYRKCRIGMHPYAAAGGGRRCSSTLPTLWESAALQPPLDGAHGHRHGVHGHTTYGHRHVAPTDTALLLPAVLQPHANAPTITINPKSLMDCPAPPLSPSEAQPPISFPGADHKPTSPKQRPWVCPPTPATHQNPHQPQPWDWRGQGGGHRVLITGSNGSHGHCGVAEEPR